MGILNLSIFDPVFFAVIRLSTCNLAAGITLRGSTSGRGGHLYSHRFSIYYNKTVNFKIVVTDCHNIAEMLLKVAFNTITLTLTL
jgi:hypothetical protein